MRRRQLFVVAPIAALTFIACQDDRPANGLCAGYLGCSAEERIVPPEAEPVAMLDDQPGVPAVGVNAVLPGAGCGKPLPADTPPTVPGTPRGYKQYTVIGTGVTLAGTLPDKAGPRTFWVRVPADYDPQRPYRVVYVGQDCGAPGSANTATLPLYDESLGGTEQAIYVAMDLPTHGASQGCYDDRDGLASQEWEAFQLFHDFVDANFCVDNNRLFVAGFGSGGRLANMWGCYFAGEGTNPAGGTGARQFAARFHIRGQAAVAGGEPAEQPACNGPVAAIWIHDTNDQVNILSGNLDALARVGRMNGCNTTYDRTTSVTTTSTTLLNPTLTNQEPWHPELELLQGCFRFKGCPEGYPVVFCTTEALGHTDQRERAATAFKVFFDELAPQTPGGFD